MKLLITAATLLAAHAAQAAQITENYPFTPAALITDNNPVATPFLASVTGSTIVSLQSVRVSFELTGDPVGTGFAHDMFASLLRSPVNVPPAITDPAAVLLNQVASFHDGWSVTVRDDAATSLQTATLVSGVLTGNFQGAQSLDGAFGGLGGNADWRFNVADLEAAGQMRLHRWTLTLVGDNGLSAVPEAGTWAAIGAVGTMVFWGWGRARRRD